MNLPDASSPDLLLVISHWSLVILSLALWGCLLLRRRVIRRLTAPENPRLTAFLIRNLFLS